MASAKSTKRTATKKASEGSTSTATRTSSRSAKRRSPKTPPEDGELLEYERLQFLKAIDGYKRKTGKTFPSWTEVLDVVRSIGWVSPMRLSSMSEDRGEA